MLSEPPYEALVVAAELGVTSTLYSPQGIAAAQAAARLVGRGMSVQLKIDTGMHRVGAWIPGTQAALRPRLANLIDRCRRARGSSELFTHLAVLADEPRTDPFTRLQLERFEEVCAAIRSAGIDPGLVHAANSAGAVAHERARLDFVRIGIAAYGQLPSPRLAPILAVQIGGERLRPVLSLRSSVHLVRRLAAGERTSYGRKYLLARDSTVVTVPIGYADGVPRSLAASGGEVLIGGRRRPIAGTVTMDQIIVDVGDDDVSVGDEVVLIGAQGDEEITATEWAERTGTIAYEILTGLSARIPRRIA